MYRGYPDDLSALALECAAEVGRTGDARARSDWAVARIVLGGDDEQALAEARRAVQQAPDNAYVRTALGIALGAARGDLDGARDEFESGSYLGDPDAALLLTLTYTQRPLDRAPLTNVRLPLSGMPQDPPKDVLDRLDALYGRSASFVYDAGFQHYLLGILYYRPRYFRESPVTLFIPGEWIRLASPRALAIEQVLKDVGRR
jgi:hypothetical protein